MQALGVLITEVGLGFDLDPGQVDDIAERVVEGLLLVGEEFAVLIRLEFVFLQRELGNQRGLAE